MTKTQGKRRIDLGVLYSRSGSYALIARACRTGALKAVEEVNADPTLDIAFTPVMRDPQGNTDAYAPLCEEILRTSTARHVIGCVTSWSRKDVIPALERANGSLWYSAPYEGFEASDRVVYTHACANQHLLPLLDFAYARYGRRVYLTGSNYIWGWETNRIGRELIQACNGEVLGEKYLPIDSVDVDHIIEDIKAKKPDFILNNLIGNSSYALFRAYQKLGQEDPEFAAAKRPIVSCNLTECELGQLGEAGIGHLSTAIYFANQTDAENTEWLARFHEFAGADRIPSAFVAQGYATVKMLAQSIRRAGNDDVPAVRHHLMRKPVQTPFGMVQIDATNNHAALTPLIGEIGEAGWFKIVSRADHAVVPDPYLVHFDADDFRRKVGKPGAGNLRVVS